MRVPFSWLNDFIKIPDSPEVAAEKLRQVGVPVTHVEYLSAGITQVFSGRIETLTPHPNADRLRVALVDLGKEKLQIVTGASNVAASDIIPVARVGATLAGGKIIQETKLRGLPSLGMMCSADELALDFKEYLPPTQREGVLILDSDTPIGIDLAPMLGLREAILVLEPFANRPDYLSIYGVAREAAAIYHLPLKNPDLYAATPGTLDGKIQVTVESSQESPRYIARYASQVKVNASPLWMAVRLNAAGIRPINNVVDVTNYVLLELGQPLHAFDCSRIQGKRIVVRQAKPNEKMVGLDEKTYDSLQNILVIADETGPVALGGIMGGKRTEISETTTEVLLEAANFNAGLVRRSSLKLGIRTESSRRFEKGLDPIGADWGSRRASFLLQQFGCQIADGAIDTQPAIPKPQEIGLNLQKMKKLLGVADLELSQVVNILKGLGFEVRTEDPLFVGPPLFRCDIHEDVDVIEEVARHYGYSHIPATLPAGMLLPATVDAEETFEETLRTFLSSVGLLEMLSYSLGDPPYFEKFYSRPLVLIQNPLTEDRKALRPLLYPEMLMNLRRNLHLKNTHLHFFEIGKTFEKLAGPQEKRSLAVLLTGDFPWGTSSNFYTLKGVLERLWQALHIETPFTLHEETKDQFHPFRCASIRHKGHGLGILGELHPNLLRSLDIDQRVMALELSVDQLQSLAGRFKMKPIPLYPESRRDISMIVEERVPAGEIIEFIRSHGGTLVEGIKIFDVYQGPQVPANKKSLAFAITYRSLEKTLTDEEVTQVHERIQKELASAFDATLRIA